MPRATLQVVEASPLRYVVSLPSEPPATGTRPPVICFLHGYDEAAPMNINRALTSHGPLRPGTLTKIQEFIIVAPQLPVAGDNWHRYHDTVKEIVTAVLEVYRGDPRRTYLTGFSYGANGVFDLAMRQPDLWAALWTVDPTRVPGRIPGPPLWLSFGEAARYRKEAFITALELTAADASPDGARVYLDQGLDHVETAASAYQDGRIYEWLLRRAATPAAPHG